MTSLPTWWGVLQCSTSSVLPSPLPAELPSSSLLLHISHSVASSSLGWRKPKKVKLLRQNRSVGLSCFLILSQLSKTTKKEEDRISVAIYHTSSCPEEEAAKKSEKRILLPNPYLSASFKKLHLPALCLLSLFLEPLAVSCIFQGSRSANLDLKLFPHTWGKFCKMLSTL